MVNPSPLTHLQRPYPAPTLPSTPMATASSEHQAFTTSSPPHLQPYCLTSQSAAKSSPSPYPTSGAIAFAGVILTSNVPGITISGILMSLGSNEFMSRIATISLASVETASSPGGLGVFIYSRSMEGRMRRRAIVQVPVAIPKFPRGADKW